MSHRRRLPAEWETQDAVMLTWPHSHSDWRPWLDETDRTFAELASCISRYQALIITCRDARHRSHINRQLEQHDARPDRCHFAIADSNDSWARDHGPITVYDNGQPVLLDFVFNGWGNKYPAQKDTRINCHLHRQGLFCNTRMRSLKTVLEGGSIDSDGRGTLLTTTRCLLAETRNPGLSGTDIEQLLRTQLGIRRILWLEHGWLAGDDTDSHIDMLARFCPAATIAYTSCEDYYDEHYAPLKKMEQELRQFRQANGQPWRLVPLPIPRAIYYERRRLPASYANFLVTNGAVLVPQYNDPKDDIALGRLRWCFPRHRIIGINALPLIRQYGSLHCVTMQLPAGILRAFGSALP